MFERIIKTVVVSFIWGFTGIGRVAFWNNILGDNLGSMIRKPKRKNEKKR